MRSFTSPSNFPTETHSESLEPIVIPIALTVPDRVAETMPNRELNLIRGTFLIRFYPKLPPSIGDTLTRNGHRWKIVGREFPELQVKGSPKADRIPTIVVEYVGEV